MSGSVTRPMEEFRPRFFLLPFFFCLLLPAARGAWTPSAASSFRDLSSSNDRAAAVYADGRGSIYAAGHVTSGTSQRAWIARYDDDLNLLSSATVAGTAVPAADRFFAVTGDAAGSIYAAGTADNTGTTGFDLLVVKYTPDLTVVSSVTITSGGGVPDFINDIALDGAGNLYAAALFNNGDLWVGRFSASDLSLLNSFTYDGPANSTDEGLGVAVDGRGSVYACGRVTNASAQGTDLWVGKFNASLGFQGSVTFDGPAGSNDEAAKMALAPDGSLYAVGMSSGAGTSDIWAVHLNPSLGLLEQAFIDGPAHRFDRGRDVAVDGRGNVYIAGNADGLGLGGSDAERDLYLARLSPSLDLLSHAVVNGSADNLDEGWGLSLDGLGNLYASGLLLETEGGSFNAWLAKYVIAGDILSAPTEDVKKVRVYPSPFKPSRDGAAAIADLPAGAEVSLHAFTGELVARFTADDLGGVSWDGRNASGEPVASGVYYGVASGQGGRKTFKVVVQK